MKNFTIPINLNGSELIDELLEANISLPEEIGSYMNVKPPMILDGYLWLDVSEYDENKVRDIVSAHNGTTVAPEPTINDKLAAVGLTVEELKEALGL